MSSALRAWSVRGVVWRDFGFGDQTCFDVAVDTIICDLSALKPDKRNDGSKIWYEYFGDDDSTNSSRRSRSWYGAPARDVGPSPAHVNPSDPRTCHITATRPHQQGSTISTLLSASPVQLDTPTYLVRCSHGVLRKVHPARQGSLDDLVELLVGFLAFRQLLRLADHVCRNLAAEVAGLVVPAVFFLYQSWSCRRCCRR